MPFYEHVFIARQDISSAQVDGLVETFTGLVENDGGKIVNSEYWGLKNLAYRIKKNRKGHYVMLNIESPVAAINELERNERLHEDVLRYLTLRVDELEEGPSVMARGRKERTGRDRDEPYRAPDTGDKPDTASKASDDKPAAGDSETVKESAE
ncbi:MAG: small subunit ribosomal protein S6 [Alphaproteobacteria bacterium]|jgi:small subunit ribosomal protein S6